jgi:hypothetical protein
VASVEPYGPPPAGLVTQPGISRGTAIALVAMAGGAFAIAYDFTAVSRAHARSDAGQEEAPRRVPTGRRALGPSYSQAPASQ